MRDRDRWWWLILLIGLAFCAAGVVSPYFGVQVIPTDNPYMTSADYWLLIGLFALLTLICLGGGLTFVVMAVRARRRHRSRLAALQGETSAMPLAEMRTDPALAPDVAEMPLELMWRMSAAGTVINVLLLGVRVILVLIQLGLALFILVAPIFVSPQPSERGLLNSTLPQPMSVAEIVLRVAVAGVVIALVILLSAVSVRAIPYLFGRPFGLSATNAGIDVRTELGSQVHMAWSEMRLLEVEKGDTKSKRRFALYGLGKRISWTEYTTGLGAEHEPVDITASEMTRRQAAVLGLIAARTGLAPRTLAKALESKPEPARTAPRISDFAAVLGLALILAGIPAAEVFLPLTSVAWVNWVSASSLALLTLGLLVAVLWTALSRRTLPAYAYPPSVAAPSLDAAGVTYVFTWSTPLVGRLLVIAGGGCLAVNLVPAAWALLQQVGPLLPGVHSQVVADGAFATAARFFLAFALGICGVIGLVLMYGGVIAAGSRSIQADKDNLTIGSGRRQQLVSWSSIQSVSWGPSGRGRFAYEVKSDELIFQISWPAGPQQASAAPPTVGTVPIGADELAALVATRIGKPIQLRG